MAAQHGVRFLKSLSPSTHAILHTQARTDTHISTFTLPLDFDPPHPFVFLTSCQKRPSESSSRDQRPDLLIGQDGEETDDCVFMSACAHTSVYVCVWVTLGTVGIVYACVAEYEYVFPSVCPSRVVFCTHPRPSLHILLHEPSTFTCTHTLLHSSPLWSVVGGVKWQVFNQCWPPHAMELICWTRLNPKRNLPPPFHLIHPLTGRGCHTQVAMFRDSLTNNMWEVDWRIKNGRFCVCSIWGYNSYIN